MATLHYNMSRCTAPKHDAHREPITQTYDVALPAAVQNQCSTTEPTEINNETDNLPRLETHPSQQC